MAKQSSRLLVSRLDIDLQATLNWYTYGVVNLENDTIKAFYQENVVTSR